MKFAIKPMMYLIMLKCLFFNIEVTLPLWCLLLLPQMRTAKSISSTLKHFLKRFLFSFLFFITFFFFCYEKADVLKLQVTENQQYMLRGWNLIFTISWSKEKCLPSDPGHEVETRVVIGPGWGSCHSSEPHALWFSIRDFPDISNSPPTWYKRQNKYEIHRYCITLHWLYNHHIRQLLWIP